MATFLPFNFNPNSVSIKTTSYTVATGYYARVTVTNLETDFTIDSVTAVEKIKWIGSTGTGTGVLFTNTSAYTLGGYCQKGTDTNQTMTGISSQTVVTQQAIYSGGNMAAGSAQDATTEATLIPDSRLYVAGGIGSGNKYWDLVALNPPVNPVFWVPEGTDLDGSKYIVELFAIP